MVKARITKLIKWKTISVHLQRWFFKIFFNHDEGKDNEISQIESHFGASSKENFVILGEGKDNKISQMEDNFRASSKVIFQNRFNHGEGKDNKISQI